LQTAREAARTQLVTLGAGLFAAGALVCTARNFTLWRRTVELSEQGQVTDRYIREHSHERSPVPGVVDTFTPEPTIRPDVQAALTVIGRRDTTHDRQRINLMSTDLRGADLAHANLSGAWLARANLSGANLSSALLNGANLTDATQSSRTSTAQTSAARTSRARSSSTRISPARISPART
jgi:hypothetical protein